MKTVWIFNHYAAGMFISHGGRHYSFAKYLIKAGYKVRIFCASSLHNQDKNLIIDGRLYYEDICDNIPYVVIKCRSYSGNGWARILNIFDFYQGLHKTAKHFEKPDVIIGSSVHPLACVAAIKLARRYHCKAIAEIRDLWPENIVTTGIRKSSSLAVQLLYRLEKWIYAMADEVIFTFEGGRDYIIDKAWDQDHGGPVDLSKVHHINNGVDLEVFDYNREHYQLADPDLDDPAVFKVVYTGAVRFVNHLGALVDVAQVLLNEGGANIKIIVYGEGNEREKLEQKCWQLALNNIVFKGAVEKKYIPYVLSRCDLNLIQALSLPSVNYGISQNKSFEYMASGKPILSAYSGKYDYIEDCGCGISLSSTDPEIYANAIIKFAQMPAGEYEGFCTRSREAAKEYDFALLTQKLIKLLDE